MDWTQIEVKWAAMTRRVRADLAAPAPRLPDQDPPATPPGDLPGTPPVVSHGDLPQPTLPELVLTKAHKVTAD